MASLNRKIGIGTLWNFLELFLSKSATTFFTIFLATLLAPEDFGLIAIIAVVFELSGVLVNAGFTQALIRSKAVRDIELSTAFWGNLGIAVAIYLLVFLLSGQIAEFFGESILEPMVQVLGIGILINSFRIVQTAILSRRMNFRPQMIAVTTGTITSGLIAIAMAYNGFGVWSLVAQMLISQAVITGILWLSTRWVPSLSFEISAFRSLFDFGKFLVIANVLNVAFKNSYAVVIGKLFSPELTGLYYFATKISNIASQQLTGALQKSSFPALSTLQDDNIQLRHKYRQIIQLIMFVIAPIMLIFIGLAEQVFELLFDERWKDAVIYTQLLCLVGLLYPIHALNINVLMVKGRSDLNLKLSLLKKAIQISILVASIPFEVLGIVVGQVIGSFIALIPNSYYTSKLIHYSFRMQMMDVIKPVIAGTIASVAAWWAMQMEMPLLVISLLFAGTAGIVVYILVSVLLRAEGATMIWVKLSDRMLKKFAKKRYGD
ncbi:lipopolysaccharide biosynthesis protein [Idiomarina abyssalis]|uniref:Lipopolysaccharide biosynthesis protein n=1 Tax=Idiomarina abyssalis TaxID=86102 RepID=A0A8I1KID5_9GAMM|nr:lipopolysaccharide biosynthesis protein [Idiomarina abyssalis]MBJ7265757.1 lipopolysaccharide biosynthesis protein [Idiomarina abyssalis]MBJ7274010.1 lipopolysaccharide biosynthesis protein [Idiomarina abyssalis]MBJ7314884.1 lipopolysaccharide biosynthesis protein [Idiomarina abyssalis]